MGTFPLKREVISFEQFYRKYENNILKVNFIEWNFHVWSSPFLTDSLRKVKRGNERFVDFEYHLLSHISQIKLTSLWWRQNTSTFNFFIILHHLQKLSSGYVFQFPILIIYFLFFSPFVTISTSFNVNQKDESLSGIIIHRKKGYFLTRYLLFLAAT